MATSVIRNFIAKQLFKQKGAIANRKAVDFSANALENRLKNLGIDPSLIRSEKELNQILGLVKQAEDQAFQKGINEMLGGSKFDRKGEVFDMTGKKINPSKGIMGGKEINEETLKEGLMETDNPFSDLVKTTEKGPKSLKEREAEVLERMNRENKESVARIKQRKMIEEAIDNVSPGFVKGDNKYNAEIVAEEIANKRGLDYSDMDTKQRADIYGEAFDALMKMRDDLAQGGRAGFSKGLGFFTNLFGKGGKMFRKRGDVPTSVFSEKTGPITIEDMANISKDDLRKIRRTQELGLYDETPEILKAGNLFERFTKKVGGKRVIDYDRAEVILNRKLRGDETLNELLQIEYQTRPGRADGGIMRLGLKEGSGMTRRTFLKLLGGMAAIPIVGKFFKLAKVGKTVTKVPLIKTDNVPGKPEWFDALVNKVIIEGDNVTKRFATAERQSIHQKTLNDGSVVRVTEDIDDGAVRVEYESVDNMYEDPVQLQYKKPLPDEGDPNPAAEFDVAESGPVGRADGPDDYSIDIDEVGGTSISDLTSDVSKLKEYATGKKQTLKEFVQSKKRKDKAKAISEGGEAEAEEVVKRQGDFEQFGDLPDEADFASGGIARMLGE